MAPCAAALRGQGSVLRVSDEARTCGRGGEQRERCELLNETESGCEYGVCDREGMECEGGEIRKGEEGGQRKKPNMHR
jgi:hypothetical protein